MSRSIRTSSAVLADAVHLRSSTEWCRLFRQNAVDLLIIPWSLSPELTEGEKRAVARSVQLFQLGESSEGRHLFRAAEEYALRSGDLDYIQAIALFIREEQRHARDLGAFLDGEGISRLQGAWTDAVFRRLRRPAGLELTIAVLLTAEIIAQVYYDYLQRATDSLVLSRLCEQILQDEARHVAFQAERLAILRDGLPGWRRALRMTGQRVLFAGTLLVVWLDHARVVRAGGGDFRPYWRRCWAAFRRAAEKMDPESWT